MGRGKRNHHRQRGGRPDAHPAGDKAADVHHAVPAGEADGAGGMSEPPEVLRGLPGIFLRRDSLLLHDTIQFVNKLNQSNRNILTFYTKRVCIFI